MFQLILHNIGYRESAFISAVLAAGVTHQISRACSQGRLLSCGCDLSAKNEKQNKRFRKNLKTENRRLINSKNSIDEPLKMNNFKKYRRKRSLRWKWSGCSHKMDFEILFSRVFLDSSEETLGDIQSQINLHNNNAGRMVRTFLI